MLNKLNTKVNNILVKNGVSEQDLMLMSESELSSIKGLGPVSVAAILEVIASNKPQEQKGQNMFSKIGELKEVFATIGEKMDTLTRRVHTIALDEGYLVKHADKLEVVVDKIGDKAGLEILDSAFIGKLRHKLPPFQIGAGFNKYQVEKAKIIMATLIAQYLLETEKLQSRIETKTSMVEGELKFRRERFIVFGREMQYKDLLTGVEEEDGVLGSKMINSKVGSKPIKYNGQQKAFARRLHSQAFKVSDICSKELLLKGYELSKGYQSVLKGNTSEDPKLMKRRYNTYAETVMDLAYLEKFYLTTWYDSRTRMYYDLQLEGIRPQGKLWETLMLDIVEPYLINKDGYKELVHIMMVTLEGRMTMKEARKRFEADRESILTSIKALRPQDLVYKDKDTLEEFGEMLLLKKLRKAYLDYKSNTPSHYIFGKDLTNSGVGIAGNAFRAEKMMYAGNYGGTVDKAVDSHTQFAEGYGLERNLIKSAHTGLLHGSTFKSMAVELQQAVKMIKVDDLVAKHGLDKGIKLAEKAVEYITEDYVKQTSLKTYGVECLNIDTIASWGGAILDNENTSLLWTMMDGWKAQSTAYMERVPLTIYTVSTINKSGYSQHAITADMPIILTSTGGQVYSKKNKAPNSKKGVTTKKRGLFANITHSVDATILRAIQTYVMDNGYIGMYKHDDFMLPLNAFKDVREVIRQQQELIREINPFQTAMEDIKTNHTRYIEMPTLLIGEAENTIGDSINFLMP